MSWLTLCNRRAVSVPTILLGVMLLPMTPAWGAGHLYDADGSTGYLFGRSAAMLEDIDVGGDSFGFDELLIGTPGDNARGKVDFWYGGLQVTLLPDGTLTGESSGDDFGWCVARIGDVNDGGRDDFAVGAPGYGTDRGRVYVFYGESLDFGGAATAADRIITGAADHDGFGFSISAAGDFDNDGSDDFIVGAPDPRPLDDGATTAGAAYIIYGGSGGPSSDLADALVLGGPAVNSRFGWSVAGIGNFASLDVDDPCVAVGAPLYDSFGLNAGAVFVYMGGSGFDATEDFTLSSGATNKAEGWYGFSVCGAGRWDGDGYSDLAVGAPYNRLASVLAGRVEIVLGDPSPSFTGDVYVVGGQSDDEFGFMVAGIGDVDGGNDDVLIGAPRVDTAGSNAGAAYIFSGGTTSQPSGPGALETYLNEPAGAAPADDLYGQAVAGGLDFDGDSTPDFVVGAPVGNNLPSGTSSGFLHLIHSTTGIVANDLQSWSADWLDGGTPGSIRIEFSLAAPAYRIETIDLLRRVQDGEGRVRDETLVWSGPPQDTTDAQPGVLYVTGTGFGLIDPGLPMVEPDDVLTYTLTARLDDGESLTLSALAGPAGVPAVSGLALRAPWPNPANPAVNVRFRARLGDEVSVRLYDVAGRLVNVLYQGAGTGAWQQEIWNGRDAQGLDAASGVYLVQVKSSEGVRGERLVLAR